MRINEELEKSLLQLEENNGDNVLSLLDIAHALENTYKYVNSCLLKDEKSFLFQTDEYICKKLKYDAKKCKTIYRVSNSDDTKAALFNIEVSNIGEINFEILGNDQDKIQNLIERVNEANSELIELVKLNADVSFFTENRELVISENPYLALKIGNFVEGDKAVLVYKMQGNDSEINKPNSGLKFIRLDQIEGYVKNIKLDERRIPILGYAFLDEQNIERYKNEKFYIMDATYPYLTSEKVEALTEDGYLKKFGETSFVVSLIGAIVLGITGGIVGASTVLPGLPLLIAGAGLPALGGTAAFLRARKNVERAFQKEDLLNEAHQKLYKVLKILANEKTKEIEKQMTFKKKKENKVITDAKSKDLSPKDIINESKRLLKEIPPYKGNLYLAVINQIENAYGLSNSLIIEEEKQKDEVIFGELLQVIDEIYDLPETPAVDAVEASMAAMKRIISYGDSNQTINSLNRYVRAYNGAGSFKENTKFVNEILNMYLEALIISKEKNETIPVQTVSSIPDNTKARLVCTLTEFSDRVYSVYQNGTDKFDAASRIRYNNGLVDTDETKIIKAINAIEESGLTYDLLGKNLSKGKVKIKEQPKVE